MKHRCPHRCHACPDMRAAAQERERAGGAAYEPKIDDLMPWCMGGVMHGRDGCYCKEETRITIRELEDKVTSLQRSLDIALRDLAALKRAAVEVVA